MRLLSTINKFLDTIGYSSQIDVFQQVLLQRVEIEMLRHLAEKPISNSVQQHDIEHRQYGDMRSVYRGYGLDYEESRPYQAGDEMRFMNWRLSARSNELYMKVFREERKPSVFILVDRRQSMRFGSQSRLKVSQAARIATYIAYRAKKQNSPIAGVVLNKTAEWVPEAPGELGVYNLLQQSNQPCAPLDNESSEVSLDHTLRLLLTMLVSGSIIYLISDFHDLDAESHPLLLQLSEEHMLTTIHVSDILEKDLSDISGVNIYNPDTKQDVYINTKQKMTHRQYHKNAVNHFANIKSSLSQYAINYVEIDTEIDSIDQQIPTS